MILDFIGDLAKRAGAICQAESATMTESRVEYKSVHDLVTPVDRKVEDFLRKEIAGSYPDHAILGEERGTSGASDSCWVIDPIDGTTSYVHGLPGYTVSIALQREGRSVAGVVYAPVLDLLFAAEEGKGATCNGRIIQVSARATLDHSVLATGFACARDGELEEGLAVFSRVLPRVRDIRRHGSAALDLALVAAGKFEGYWEKGLKLYDYAAGILLVAEAGGRVVDFHRGGDFLQDGLVATNGLIEDELLAHIVAE